MYTVTVYTGEEGEVLFATTVKTIAEAKLIKHNLLTRLKMPLITATITTD